MKFFSSFRDRVKECALVTSLHLWDNCCALILCNLQEILLSRYTFIIDSAVIDINCFMSLKIELYIRLRL